MFKIPTYFKNLCFSWTIYKKKTLTFCDFVKNATTFVFHKNMQISIHFRSFLQTEIKKNIYIFIQILLVLIKIPFIYFILVCVDLLRTPRKCKHSLTLWNNCANLVTVKKNSGTKTTSFQCIKIRSIFILSLPRPHLPQPQPGRPRVLRFREQPHFRPDPRPKLGQLCRSRRRQMQSRSLGGHLRRHGHED